MGLFSKEVCCLCGKKAGLLTRQKIANKQYLCSDCRDLCSPDMHEDEFLDLDTNSIRSHIAYREQNADLLNTQFQITDSIKSGALSRKEVMAVDGNHGWFISSQKKNPDIIEFSQIMNYELHIDFIHRGPDDNTPPMRVMPPRADMPMCPPDADVSRMDVDIYVNHPWLHRVSIPVMDALIVTEQDVQDGYDTAARIFDVLDYHRNLAASAAASAEAAASAPAASAADNVEAIKKYKELLDMGIITAEEFAAKKKELLGL